MRVKIKTARGGKKMLLIKNGLVHTMERPEAIAVDILARDGKIVCMAKSIEPGDNMDVFDAAGLQVFPGLIDAHSHIGISEERSGRQGDDCNEFTTPVTPCLRAVDAINPMDLSLIHI